MLQHFQYSPLYRNENIPGWNFSFYFNGKKYEGIYKQNGGIDWLTQAPDAKSVQNIEKYIHDLMLYHVYDQC